MKTAKARHVLRQHVGASHYQEMKEVSFSSLTHPMFTEISIRAVTSVLGTLSNGQMCPITCFNTDTCMKDWEAACA